MKLFGGGGREEGEGVKEIIKFHYLNRYNGRLWCDASMPERGKQSPQFELVYTWSY